MAHLKHLARYSPSKAEYERQAIELIQRFYKIYQDQKNTTFNYSSNHYDKYIKSEAGYFLVVSNAFFSSIKIVIEIMVPVDKTLIIVQSPTK